jgi:hypothetical protein
LHFQFGEDVAATTRSLDHALDAAVDSYSSGVSANIRLKRPVQVRNRFKVTG